MKVEIVRRRGSSREGREGEYGGGDVQSAESSEFGFREGVEIDARRSYDRLKGELGFCEEGGDTDDLRGLEGGDAGRGAAEIEGRGGWDQPGSELSV